MVEARDIIARVIAGGDASDLTASELASWCKWKRVFPDDILAALTAAGWTLAPPGSRVVPEGGVDAWRILSNLDPENARDDSLLLDIHARLQRHGEKYPDRAVSVLHRNVVLYTIAAALRALAEAKP